ncbi:MAG TPA: aspartate-semialdehyde dehydrogenase, partial [bacterium]|nr:aspartate-semialdehyde dehydrogenase [bacterium]
MASAKTCVVGATGAVGQEFLRILEQRDFPMSRLRLLASERSAGKRIAFRGKDYTVELLTENSFEKGEIILSSAGGGTSKWFVPHAVKSGAVVVDNTSAFRMEPEVPLVVPEVNPHAIQRHKGIIANPNCSTIQMVVALKPLHDVSRIKRIVVSTYQSVSGKGAKAMEELRLQTKALLDEKPYPPKEFPWQIAFNCLPHIDSFTDNGFTKEELKMVYETQKIMEDDSIAVNATTIRVPVLRSHSESVYIETEKKITAQQAREILSKAPGVIVVDDPANNKYPMPVDSEGRDETFVGRIR